MPGEAERANASGIPVGIISKIEGIKAGELIDVHVIQFVSSKYLCIKHRPHDRIATEVASAGEHCSRLLGTPDMVEAM